MKKETKNQKPMPGRTTRNLILAGIFFLTVVLFYRTLGFEILYGWDDGEYIGDPAIRELSVRNTTGYFTTYHLGMYQPFPVLSLALQFSASGEKAFPYHALNLLIHLFNVALIFFLVHTLTGKLTAAVTVALLSAIHPMHVEAVVWISTRSNLVYSAFYLLALIFYVRYIRESGLKWLIYCGLFFILSLFSKSMAVTFPLVMFILDYMNGRKINKKVILEKIPFLLLSVVFGIIAIHASSSYGHIRNLAFDYHFVDRFFMFSYAIVFYIARALFPLNLSAVYAYPVKENGFLPAEYYLSVIGILILIFIAWKIRNHRKEYLSGLLFFLVSISVVLPVVWSRMFMLADRYTYIPYIGIFLVPALIIPGLFSRTGFNKNRIMRFLPAAAIIYFIFLYISAWRYTGTWSNSFMIAENIIRQERSDADVAIGYFFRGNMNDRAGRPESALADFTCAVELNPFYTMAYNNRGIVKGMLKDYEGALLDFSKAIELEKDYADAWYNRGNAHYYAGKADQACNDWEKAGRLGSKQAEKIRSKYCK